MAPKLEISGTPRAPQAPPSHSAGNLNLLRFVPGSRTVRNIAATGAALVFAAGVLYIGEGIEHELHNFGFDINIGGTNPPDSTGTLIPATAEAFPIHVDCTDEVSVDVGVKSVEQVAWISGINHDHLEPMTYLVCGPNGFTAMEQKYKDAAGNIVKVVVDEPFYSPTNARINYNNGAVVCEDLSSTATMTQIKDAEKAYNKARSKGQTIHCDFRQNTTGAGFASVNDADIELLADEVSAQDAASLSPIPSKIEGTIDSDIKAAIDSEVQPEYPGAQIDVKDPVYDSTLTQIEHNWDVNSGDITNDAYLRNITVLKAGDRTEFKEKLIYDGSTIKYFIPGNLTPRQVSMLSKYIHNRKHIGPASF